MGKRNQHDKEHQIKIRQSDKLKMTDRRTYMKPTIEQKYAWEQFLTKSKQEQTQKRRNKPITKIKHTNTNIHENEDQSKRYEVRE